ncbi:hypothetical protein HD806DRAFT_538780 [Xylariaceae sp. AK1471]|nr:hypothetical protein HD806DRAFT_538780 [Xylariaceae sp. AK1471]
MPNYFDDEFLITALIDDMPRVPDSFSFPAVNTDSFLDSFSTGEAAMDLGSFQIDDIPTAPASFPFPEVTADEVASSIPAPEVSPVPILLATQIVTTDAVPISALAHEACAIPSLSPTPALNLDEALSPVSTHEAVTPSQEGLDMPSPMGSVSRSGSFPCQACGKILSRRDALVRHCRSKHRMGSNYYCPEQRCAEYNRGFRRLHDFRRHMRVNHNREVSTEDARACQQVDPISNPSRSSSASYQPQLRQQRQALAVANENGFSPAAVQVQPAGNLQPVSSQYINGYQAQVLPAQPPAHSNVDAAQLVQILGARTNENGLLRQHIVALRQQLQNMRLERDRLLLTRQQLLRELSCRNDCDAFQNPFLTSGVDMDTVPSFFEDEFYISAPLIQDSPMVSYSFPFPEAATEAVHNPFPSDEAPIVLTSSSLDEISTDTAPIVIPAQVVDPVPDVSAVPDLATDVSPSPIPASEVATAPPEELNTSSPTRSVSRSGAFPCPECGKILARRDSLVRHCRVKHGMGQNYYCKEPRCAELSKGYRRLRDFRNHMRVVHNKNMSAEDARVHQEARYTSEWSRASSTASEPQHVLPVANTNSYSAVAIQTQITQNSQIIMDVHQAPVQTMTQPPVYTRADATRSVSHRMMNGAHAIDLNNTDQLVQLLGARTSENRLLHQHIVVLQQQLLNLRLGHDRYATAYLQVCQQNQRMRAYIQMQQQMSQRNQ